MLKRAYVGVGLFVGLAGICAADSIILDGKTLENVYIREGASMYYVQIPADGSVVSVPKSSVTASDVRIADDVAERDALRREWKRNNEALRQTPQEAPDPVPANSAAVDKSPVTDRESSGEGRRAAPRVDSGDGPVAHVKLKDVPLRDALKATLRPMGLDYKVESNYVRIARPEQLRQEPYEALDTRFYQLQSGTAGTLPKVVTQNPGGTVGPGTSGAYGGGYGGMYGGGMGYGGGSGMTGGGFGGARYGGGAQFQSLIQLFTTIDDRRVGEPPAIIGTTGLNK